MVNLHCPTPILEVPERIHGARLSFQDLYADGRDCGYSGVCRSISGLLDALVSRLSCDSSILYVGVSLPSGRLIIECSR